MEFLLPQKQAIINIAAAVGFFVIVSTYDHGYENYESYTIFEDGFEFSDLIEDAFHRNFKSY